MSDGRAVSAPVPVRAIRPNVVEAFGSSRAFQPASRTVTFSPSTVQLPFHRPLIRWPRGSVHYTFQPDSPAVRSLCTVTCTW